MKEIENIRAKIDLIDDKIIELLQARKSEVLKIKKIKKENAIAAVDPEREKKILSKAKDKYSESIFKKILTESRKIQRDEGSG